MADFPIRGASIHSASDEPVIPIHELSEYLMDDQLQGEEPTKEFIKKIEMNLEFYSNWFPKQTRHEIQKAHRKLRQEDELAPSALMKYEVLYLPSAKRFTKWMEQSANKWCERLDLSGQLNDSLEENFHDYFELADLWLSSKKLLPRQEERVRQAFGKIYHELIHKKIDSMIVSCACSMSGLKKEEPTWDEILAEGIFSKEPPETLAILNHYLYKTDELSEAQARQVWQFLSSGETYSRIYESADYWHLLRRFLENHTANIPAFLENRSLWESHIPSGGDGRDQASEKSLYYLYCVLSENDLIPDTQKKEAYLFIVKQAYGDNEEYKILESVEEIETKLILDFFRNTGGNPNRYSFIDDVVEKLFEKMTRARGAKEMIRILEAGLPEGFTSRSSLSFRLMRVFVDHSEEDARFFLTEFQHPDSWDRDAIQKDPMLRKIWDLFSVPSNGWGDAFATIDLDTDYKRYDYYIKNFPDQLIGLGMEDVLKDFYLANHPYSEIYALDESIRPTGEGIGYISIDMHLNPTEFPHPDKPDAQVLPISNPVWQDGTSKSHGYSVSSVAVGNTLGLAPGATLYLSPINDRRKTSCVITATTAQDLRRASRLVRHNHEIDIVGMSLGMEVHHDFQDMVQSSRVYKQLSRYTKRIHRSGGGVVAAAGNDGHEDHVNVLGMLPHVILAGAMNSQQLNPNESTHKPSDYTTASNEDSINPVRLYAHADPILSYGRKDKMTWYPQGGTSHAQPHLAGALILLRDVNPTLTFDERVRILAITKNNFDHSGQTGSIDPAKAIIAAAHLPGSRYEGARLAQLTEELLEISESEYLLPPELVIP